MADLEQLRAIDEAYRRAGEAADQKWDALGRAETEENHLGWERLELYNNVLAKGFVIERVVNPGKIIYLAGYIGAGSLFEPEDRPQLITIDESHAESLTGAFATAAHINSAGFVRSIKDIIGGKPQPDLTVSFEVAGVHGNAEVSSRIRRDKRDQVTSYSAELTAIEWRLPTEEEIRTFGSLATTAAQ